MEFGTGKLGGIKFYKLEITNSIEYNEQYTEKKNEETKKKNRNSRDEIPLSLYIIYLFFLLIVNIPLSVNISKVIKAINQSIKCNINPKIKKNSLQVVHLRMKTIYSMSEYGCVGPDFNGCA